MTEALSQGTPLAVCPGFGDQVTNGFKAEALGVGLKVGRPGPDLGLEVEAAAGYRRDVSRAVREVLSQPNYRRAAGACATRLARAGGVPRATDLVMEAAAARSGSCSQLKVEPAKVCCMYRACGG